MRKLKKLRPAAAAQSKSNRQHTWVSLPPRISLVYFSSSTILPRLWSYYSKRGMSSQKTISSFFKAVPKRKSLNDEDNEICKKLKPCDENTSLHNVQESPSKTSKPPNDLSLTPNQKDRIYQNKIKAEIKLQCKKTPALHENIGISWYNALHSQFPKPYFQKLSEFLLSEREKGTIYPPAEEVYSWTQYCQLEDVKVVVLGQDPYHGPRQAHGLCFSVTPGVPPPPSLVNMYKELAADIPGFVIPPHGFLLGWAKQGVLLLNACLTVRAHNANSHKDRGWEKFTDEVIKAVSQRNKGVVFLLWGSYAQKKAAVVDKKKHHLLRAPHPSPLSAHRGFLGCKHFSQCNELLKKEGKTPIDWSYLPKEA